MKQIANVKRSVANSPFLQTRLQSFFVIHCLYYFFKRGERKDSHPGFWWADDKGHEVQWSFQQLAEGSRR